LKVLLTVPPGRLFLTANHATTPIGILYCAAYLEENGHSVKVVDSLTEKLNHEDVLRIISQDDYVLIGISVITDNRFSAFELAVQIKERFPDKKIVLGGPHVTLDPIDTMRFHKAVDYIVAGEGETTLLELVDTLKQNDNVSSVGGLYYRDGGDGKIKFSGAAELVTNLDKFPYPARHLIDLERYGMYSEIKKRGRLESVNMVISRGCPIGCNFCSNTLIWGKSIRRRSNENIINEIVYIKKRYKISSFAFQDDTFNFHKGKLVELCEEIIRQNLNIYWSCAFRADNFDEKLIAIMKEAGCFRIHYGVESGSKRILDNVVKKKIDLNKVVHLSKLLNKYEIENLPSFIISFPSETYNDALETLSFMERLQAGPVLNICKIYPGTDIEKTALEKGLLPKSFSWAEEKCMKEVKEAIPDLLGEVPFYVEKLTWLQISTILFKWSNTVDFDVWASALSGIKSIRNINDLLRLMIMGIAYLKVKIKSVLLLKF